MNSKGKNQVKEVAGAKGAAHTVPGLWQALSKRWLRGRGTDSGLTPRGEREAGVTRARSRDPRKPQLSARAPRWEPPLPSPSMLSLSLGRRCELVPQESCLLQGLASGLWAGGASGSAVPLEEGRAEALGEDQAASLLPPGKGARLDFLHQRIHLR